MSRHFVIGCQRSGTTMLEGVLRAHPDYHYFWGEHRDETKINKFLGRGESSYDQTKYFFCYSEKLIGYRIPELTCSQDILDLADIPGNKIVGIIRHPIDVIVSMLKMKWVSFYALQQLDYTINGCYGRRGCFQSPEFQDILIKHHNKIKKVIEINLPLEAACYVWLLSAYRIEHPSIIKIKYEDFVKDVKNQVPDLFRKLDLSIIDIDSYFEMKQNQTGGYAKSDFSKIPNPESIGKNRHLLSKEYYKVVKDIIGERAEELGYEI